MSSVENSKIEQVTLALSFLAYEESAEAIEANLKSLEPVIGRYSIVWGPAFHYSLLKKTDGMTYIVQDLNHPNEYFVSIRGTTPLTISEWLFQDFWVGSLISWKTVPYEKLLPPPPPSPDTPAVSFGINNAMNILLKQINDQEIDICSFLQKQAEDSKQPITIYITGHSLGGVLSPTFALYLCEHWPDNICKPHISIYGYAGPTAGNQPFANYSNQIIGNNCQVFENKLDVIPHAWNVNNMKEIPNLYQSLEMPAYLLRILNKIAIPAVEDKGYSQIGAKQPEIPSKVVEFWFSNEYLIQMIYQHVIPYLAEFIRLSPLTDRDRLINLMESWEYVKTFKSLKPLSNAQGRDLGYYLELLGNA